MDKRRDKANPKAMIVDPAALAVLPLAKRDNTRHIGWAGLAKAA